MSTEQLITQIILTVSICMITGLLVTRLVRLLNLPDVTAYLIAGVLVGTFCLGGVSLGGYYLGYNEHVFKQETLGVVLDVICSLALGFIAFAIGSEFRWSCADRSAFLAWRRNSALACCDPAGCYRIRNRTCCNADGRSSV